MCNEKRPWGRFEVLLSKPYFKLKKLMVNPQQRLSYQSHKLRQECWTVINGEATVILNDNEIKVKYGESITIPIGAKHRIINKGDQLLEIIEVQTGEYFGEDDIIRYEDDYNRK
ncbi:MAG: phosphomannose isomerase type II C-terminal cupin domain [Lishizhenia sp.]